MRLRASVLACALAMLGSFAAAGLASAAPHHNRGLTIGVTPNPVSAGDAVIVYGRLLGPNSGQEPIRLYHHVIGSGQGYTYVTTTFTNSSGYYEFLGPDGLVYSNRNYFVRGPDGSHSRTFHERVSALVSITPSTASTDTNHAIVFSGHVIPNRRFEQVFLQQEIGTGDDWRTLRSTTLDPGSNYFVAYRWRRPGVHDVRVVFRGDARNARGTSDVVTVNIEQAQIPGFTINSSDPIVPSGGSVTIRGVLDQPSTTNPVIQNTIVQLWGRMPDQRHFTVIADAPTGMNGSYSFSQTSLTTNMVYFVATMPLPHSPRRHTALLYQGVQDIVTMQVAQTSTSTGQTFTFTGNVQPNKAGHVIYLQKLGKDGDWHTVQIGIVQQDSGYQFTWTAGAPGPYSFRARITSDEDNIGSASPRVNVTATAPTPSSLPPTS
jgi:hypothetical protein